MAAAIAGLILALALTSDNNNSAPGFPGPPGVFGQAPPQGGSLPGLPPGVQPYGQGGGSQGGTR
jgi:hypothetical protein